MSALKPARQLSWAPSYPRGGFGFSGLLGETVRGVCAGLGARALSTKPAWGSRGRDFAPGSRFSICDMG